ncbi:hypothetical protein C482_03591 [Natrialba chahannaoensis JCM 10990]|uniref:Uncharacterized protein n=1 Tax=Natrialba chahannaoensis JCM 10990 TaxID=1227492 RepID=M0B354_9EURY|nr:hypothetical protein [Natrialba chahannaoensis]ELZ04084.1 hypothetical protein C482_03591 [Natrialba chahannaoensis JCM 10990]
MTNSEGENRTAVSTARTYTVGRNQYRDTWTVDENGCLHTGTATATPFVERTTTSTQPAVTGRGVRKP